MKIPKVENNESFELYLARWPENFTNIPDDVIRNWIYYHNEFVIDNSDVYELEKWRFEKRIFTTEEVLTIKHYDSEMKYLDHIGDILMEQGMPDYDTAEFMIEHGTFPCPIIVAHNAGEFSHAKSLQGETMLEPYHLIEGNRRLGFIRGMAKHNFHKLQHNHEVWVVTIT